MSGPIKAWSYSRWSAYQECPFKAKCKFVDKLQEPGSEAMDRGDRIHKAIEAYLARGGRLPKEATPMKAELAKLRKLKPIVEGELAFNARWEPVDWFARDAWCRVKTDALVPPELDGETLARNIDFKTGKLREAGEHDDQLLLYGLAGLLKFPVATAATGEIWFTDHGRIVKRDEGVYLRKDVPKIEKLWEGRVKKMLSDTVFKPTPGNYCRFCHFRRANGGPCQF